MAAIVAGKLGSADLVQLTMTQPYTVPAGRFAAYTLTLCNRTANTAKIRFALATSGTVTADQYKEYDTPLLGNTTLQITGIAGPGNLPSVQSDIAGVSCVIEGIEEDVI